MAHVAAGGLATPDDRGRRAPAADGADVPQAERLRPGRFPGAEVHVTERAAQANAGVARRAVAVSDAVVARHLHVELSLEPRRHAAAEALRGAQAPVRG